MISSSKSGSIDDYIDGFPKEIQEKLESIRSAIHEAIPNAGEDIKYGMPTFVQNGNVIHFAGFKNHIGIYPAPSGIEEFKDDLEKYQTSKGTIQIPMDEEIPLKLIQRIAIFRAKENSKKDGKKY